eukprot:766019-Hanusia_phi.AAC.6
MQVPELDPEGIHPVFISSFGHCKHGSQIVSVDISALFFNNKPRDEPAKQTDDDEAGVPLEGEQEGPPEPDVVGDDDDDGVEGDEEGLEQQPLG